MSSPANHTSPAAHGSPVVVHEPDAIEAIVPLIPVVLPLVGGVLIFLLAFIVCKGLRTLFSEWGICQYIIVCNRRSCN